MIQGSIASRNFAFNHRDILQVHDHIAYTYRVTLVLLKFGSNRDHYDRYQDGMILIEFMDIATEQEILEYNIENLTFFDTVDDSGSANVFWFVHLHTP